MGEVAPHSDGRVGWRRLGFAQWVIQLQGLGYFVLKGVDTAAIGTPGTQTTINSLNVNTGN